MKKDKPHLPAGNSYTRDRAKTEPDRKKETSRNLCREKIEKDEE